MDSSAFLMHDYVRIARAAPKLITGEEAERWISQEETGPFDRGTMLQTLIVTKKKARKVRCSRHCNCVQRNESILVYIEEEKWK